MIIFSYQVLEERIDMLVHSFDRFYTVMTRYAQGTSQYTTALKNCIHVMKQIFKLEGLARMAPSEESIEQNLGREAARTASAHNRITKVTINEE